MTSPPQQCCKEDGAVGLVKIDAEGAEADILKGAQPRTLKAIGQFVMNTTICSVIMRSHAASGVLANAGFHCITRPMELALGQLHAMSGAVIAERFRCVYDKVG